jgi:Sulfotransferase family
MTGKQASHPFIYIAALIRTGSTLLSEILTELPYSFIFHEPHIGKNTFRAQDPDIALLGSYGIDLPRFLKLRLPLAFFFRRLRFLGYRQDYMVRQVKEYLIPRMSEAALQVGVKEVDNRGWRNYVRHFPNMRVILTGRDPRDIYLSICHKWQRGTLKRYQSISQSLILADLDRQFQIQKSLFIATDCMKVRYEDLCTGFETIVAIKEFVSSPLVAIGRPGRFIAATEIRKDEAILHGGHITAQQVERWKRETDPQLMAEALQVYNQMEEYRNFWGYP